MVSVDDLVDEIVSKNPSVSRENILKRLEEERERSGGLISDDVLLRMIAADFGVKLANAVQSPSLAIGSLIPGLNDVSLAGRIIAVYPSKSLGKKRSRVASVLVADRSGAVRVVLWNDKAELVNSGKLRTGQVARFNHGYTREGRHGHVELHLSGKGTVEIIEGEEAKDYPDITELSTKIGNITATLQNKRVNLVGRVKGDIHESAFERSNKSAGKVLRFTLADETGEVPIVVWNERVDEVKRLLGNKIRLQIVNAKVKKALDGRMEINVDGETYIDVLTFPSKKEFWKIAELREGMKNISVQGTVATKPLIRKVKTARGETVNLTVFEIKDETGSIWVSAWRENAEKTANLKIGEKIAIKKADVKKGFADQLEVTTKKATAIEILG